METEVPEIVMHVVAVIEILVPWIVCPSGFQGMCTMLGQEETSDRTTVENSDPGAPDSQFSVPRLDPSVVFDNLY